MNRDDELTEWGKGFEKVRAEKRMSYNDAIAALRMHKGFEKLNRSTLYRWEVKDHHGDMKNVERKAYALQVLSQLSVQSPATEFVGKLIDELREIDEELQRLQHRVRELIAASTFHRSQ